MGNVSQNVMHLKKILINQRNNQTMPVWDLKVNCLHVQVRLRYFFFFPVGMKNSPDESNWRCATEDSPVWSCKLPSQVNLFPYATRENLPASACGSINFIIPFCFLFKRICFPIVKIRQPYHHHQQQQSLWS